MLCLLALLNDAALAEGGTPQVMHGESTVSMASEDIQIRVTAEKTTADCTFVFQNRGPKVTIKMGFPDHGFGAADPEEEMDPSARKNPPKTGAMTAFQSWVAGKPVRTVLERGKEAGEYWHTKSVTFPANAATVVRDRYSLPQSGAIVAYKQGEGSASYAGYVVSTGASWHGTIGRSVVTFELPMKVTRVVAQSTVISSDRRQFKVDRFPEGTVVYRGMATPTLAGRTLRFERRNWKPKPADDIELWFDFRRAGN